MKPAPFRYFAPASLDEATSLMSQYGSEARLLAGGQSLVPSLNFRCLTPAVIVDLNPIAGLDEIQPSAGGLKLGAMTRYSTLETSPVVATAAPLMHAAIPYIAHTAIRTRGTLGGSLAYADPAAELPTVTLALGAHYRLVSTRGERIITAEDFFQKMFFTAIQPDEILVEVELPPQAENTAWGFVETARRHGDRVMMGVAASVTLRPGGEIASARLVYQNAAPVPFYARQASALLAGEQPSPTLIEAAAVAAGQEIEPVSDAHATAAFRRWLAAELTRRALQQALLPGKSNGGNGKTTLVI